MPSDLRVPAVVPGRQDGVAADRALTALLVAVEEVDGEGLTLEEGATEGRSEGVVGIADRRFPVPGSPGRDVQVDPQPAERLRTGMGELPEGLVGGRMPTVQDGDPASEVAEPDGQVEDALLLLEDGPTATDRAV